MDDFRRAIYPIWKRIDDEDRAGDTMNSPDILSECSTLHAQDVAIQKSGQRPTMIVVTQAKANEWRKKAAAGEKMGRWSEQ